MAILDTGIRRTHEFFQGKNIVEACFASGDGNGVGDCPNGQTEMTGPGAAAHYENTYWAWDHGTHVAGIATGNNGAFFGVARDSDIIAVQIFSRFSADVCGGTPCVMSWDSDQLKGLEYVYMLRGTYNIASVNMSLGGGGYSSYCDEDSLKSAIDNLRAVRIATAIATGNDGACGYVDAPSCISSAVSVGATTKADTEASFNNWSETLLDLFAPGSSIRSSTGDSDSSYEYWNGTSMATPHVAGAWALIRQARPSDGVGAILASLINTGTPVAARCAGDPSKPRINVDEAILALTPTPCSQCTDDPVVLQNKIFPSGTNCDCVASTFITVGAGVTVQAGAAVNFKAPVVRVLEGARFEPGAQVNIKQQQDVHEGWGSAQNK